MKTNYSIFKKENWFNMKYDGRRREFRRISRQEFNAAKEKAIYRRFFRVPYEAKSLLRRCYEAVSEWAKPEHGNYQKVVMYGNTWLYLCSPIFGHKDYNKSRLMPIEGNEKECEFLMSVSKRVSKTQNTLS